MIQMAGACPGRTVPDQPKLAELEVMFASWWLCTEGFCFVFGDFIVAFRCA